MSFPTLHFTFSPLTFIGHNYALNVMLGAISNDFCTPRISNWGDWKEQTVNHIRGLKAADVEEEVNDWRSLETLGMGEALGSLGMRGCQAQHHGDLPFLTPGGLKAWEHWGRLCVSESKGTLWQRCQQNTVNTNRLVELGVVGLIFATMLHSK